MRLKEPSVLGRKGVAGMAENEAEELSENHIGSINLNALLRHINFIPW